MSFERIITMVQPYCPNFRMITEMFRGSDFSLWCNCLLDKKTRWLKVLYHSPEIQFLHFDYLAWGRGSWSLCLSCICLSALHTLICVTFSLPPGVGGWLQLLLVALPGLYYLPFLFWVTLDNDQRTLTSGTYISPCTHLSLVTRKPVFGVCDQVRLKLACFISEAS